MLLLSSIGRQLRCLWCDVRSPHCGHLAHTPTRLQYHRIFAIQQYNPSKKSFGSTSSTTQSNKSNSNVNGTVTLPDSRARRVSTDNPERLARSATDNSRICLKACKFPAIRFRTNSIIFLNLPISSYKQPSKGRLRRSYWLSAVFYLRTMSRTSKCLRHP